MLDTIQIALKSFAAGNLTENALHLFQTLGYESERRLPFEDKSFADFSAYITTESNFNEKNAIASEWKYVDLLFQLTESELTSQNLMFDKTAIDQRITSYLFFVIELTEGNYSRTALSQITREVNKVFQIPAMILFKYGALLTLAVIDRQPHKRDETKDVLRKVTLVKDINFQKTHRAHLDILADLSLSKIKGNPNFKINSFLDLHHAWQKTLDVELITNKFFRDYKTVFDTVEREVEQTITDKETARLFTQRLFNRLMFIYFLQKKGWLMFENSTNYLRRLFDKAQASGENFYRHRLYWVFFYGLSNVGESTEIHEHEFLRERRGDAPYLNGGLFEIDADGWDERGKVELSNQLFTEIFKLFEHYNFTVEESTPLEVQVAIDPEILGRVFEELVTGRHESGSYYTPRQIVSFMCRESLKYYLKNAASEPSAGAGGFARKDEGGRMRDETKEEGSSLISKLSSVIADGSDPFSEFVDEGRAENLSDPEAVLDALKKIRVCDPACGSGAYLLGMMQELLRLRDALFTSKHLGDASLYNRKREIIENNVYGVDKDRFAVQIASLRLWLSLAIESKEPRPLPNLKYKIGCGDALLAPLETDLQPDLHRRALIEQFRALKAKYSCAFDHEQKREIDDQIKHLRVQLAQSLHHLPEPPKPHKIVVAEAEATRLHDTVQKFVLARDRNAVLKYQSQLDRLTDDISDWKRQIELTDYKPDFFDWTVEFAEIFEPETLEMQKPARSKGADGATNEERPYSVRALQKAVLTLCWQIRRTSDRNCLEKITKKMV